MGLIKKARQNRKLSTTELAHRLGVSQSSIVRMEQSEDAKSISLSSLERVAAALGLRFTYNLEPVFGNDVILPPSSSRKRFRIKRTVPRKSQTAEQLKEEVSVYSRQLSFEKRIEQTCALSDLAREFRSV